MLYDSVNRMHDAVFIFIRELFGGNHFFWDSLFQFQISYTNQRINRNPPTWQPSQYWVWPVAELLQKQEAGVYYAWNDKWIIQNVEPGLNKIFNDKDRNAHSGFGTKVIFGPFSKRARKYYNHRTRQVGKIKDLRK